MYSCIRQRVNPRGGAPNLDAERQRGAAHRLCREVFLVVDDEPPARGQPVLVLALLPQEHRLHLDAHPTIPQNAQYLKSAFSVYCVKEYTTFCCRVHHGRRGAEIAFQVGSMALWTVTV